MNIKSKKILAQLSAVVLVGSAMTAPIAGMAEDVVTDAETAPVAVENVAPVAQETEAPVETPVEEAPVVEVSSEEVTTDTETEVSTETSTEAGEEETTEAEETEEETEEETTEAVANVDVKNVVSSGASGAPVVEKAYGAPVISTPDWSDAYSSYVLDKGGDYRFDFVYIDDDDIPELVVTNGEGRACKSEVVRWNPKTKQIESLTDGSDYGTLYYSARGNVILNNYNENSDDSPYAFRGTVVRLENGQPDERIVFNWEVDNKTNQKKFYINGVQVEEEEYVEKVAEFKVITNADGSKSALGKNLTTVKYADMNGSDPFSVGVVIGSLVSGNKITSSKVEASAWGSAYKTFISEDYKANGNATKFAMAYVDGDDIPELILTDSTGAVSKIYTYNKDGKVVKVDTGSDKGNFFFSEKTGLVLRENGGQFDVLRLDGSNFTTLVSFKESEGLNGKKIYEVNGEKVTKDVYDSTLEYYNVVLKRTPSNEFQGSVLGKKIEAVNYNSMALANDYNVGLVLGELVDGHTNTPASPVVVPGTATNNNGGTNNGGGSANNAPAPASAPASSESSDASPETGDKGVGAIFGALALSAGALFVSSKKRNRS
ncbi:MAG: NPXTG-anchored protein [Ruminococcus sp.]|nr:NPXTG-anchored protein [Ruminococcus sp.]